LTIPYIINLLWCLLRADADGSTATAAAIEGRGAAVNKAFPWHWQLHQM
jgi:hypothetical protein